MKSQVDQSQREYYLREQMKAIRQELGDQDAQAETLTQLRQRIKDAEMPEAVEAEATREVDRM